MTARLETSAEILKLARLLSIDPKELAYLDEVPASEVRDVREETTELLFSSGAKALSRVAAAARLIPSPLVASIAHKSFGPLLCARAAAAVDPGKAIDVAKRLPADFLADVTVELDPRRVAQIIGNVPEELVVPVAAELGRRDEHVTMGRFLAFVPDHAIAAAMTALSDEAMLRTAFVLEHKDRLDHAIGLLPEGRLTSIIRCASDLDLWPEALDLLEHLSDERRGPIADVVAEQDADVIERLVAAVSAADLWESLLPVVGMMSDSHRPILATRSAFHDPAVLAEIIRAAEANYLWGDLLPLIDALPEDVRETAANLVADQDETTIISLLEASVASGLWDILVPLVRTMSPERRDRLAGMTAITQLAEKAGLRAELDAALALEPSPQT